MLETKDLYKKYKPKKGQEVVAVDHVSLRFPEKGMVFLLGKSGSGKSTMLNLLGGLDSYDGGEIIIKGISSKDFNQQRFDSYRNTYVGFIFQEYNVLEEFNVGANIALALELQGKKATDEEINHILHEVDLDGFGDRNPNELSGGQKQRVAIARALVKNPEIIMADEPTGALDSNTGRQVFETLKKLSADKLVVIVSHDRDYAEQYADRIIELADGKVIRDVEADHSASDETGIVFRASTLEIPSGYHLTEEDRIRINEYIDALDSGLTVSLSEKYARFKETDQSGIPAQDGSDFKLIKSVLPLKSAFRIGRSSLKHKKFRLVMTIFLSVVAFSLFAFVDTFSSYDMVRNCVDSLKDSDIEYISLGKAIKAGEGIDTWWRTLSSGLSDEDLKNIENDTGIAVSGIFKPELMDLEFGENIGISEEERANSDEDTDFTSMRYFCGFSEITEESLKNMGYTLISGRIPDGNKKEIAISRFAAETFIKSGYLTALPEKDYAKGMNMRPTPVYGKEEADDVSKRIERKKRAEKFSDPMYMVGKTLLLNNELYTVTGVVDTNFDVSRYELLNKPQDKLTKTETVISMLLHSEYSYAVNNSLTGAAMTGTGAVEKLAANEPKIYRSEKGDLNIHAWDHNSDSSISMWNSYNAKLSDIPENEIIWTEGPLKELKDNEVIITLDCASRYSNGREQYFVPESGEITKQNLDDLIKAIEETGGLEAYVYIYNSERNMNGDNELKDIKIVGCFTSDSLYNKAGAFAISDALVEKLSDVSDGIYNCAVGPMPKDKASMERIVNYCYRDSDDITVRYEMNNAVVYELDTFNTVIKAAAKIVFWIGVFFAVFASLLMANFISVSISYKKQEIGILRAIGSRSNDVFRIFFSESFIIAMIEFVLTSVLCLAAVIVINHIIRNETGILITMLHFGIRQILLTFVISIAVSALASFFPVRKTAAKKPIDAIRGR